MQIAKFCITVYFLLFLRTLCFADSPANGPREYSPPPDSSPTSFMYTVDIAKLQTKFARPVPHWMFDRFQKELEPFEKKKISQRALNATYDRLKKMTHTFTRYRFIDRKIYRLGEDPFGMDAFYRTIARLADYPQILDLPNIDIIVNQDDATPLDFQSRDFWFTQNFEDQAPIFTYARKDLPFLISMPDRFTFHLWASLAQKILSTNPHFDWDSKTKMAFWRGEANDFPRLGIGGRPYAEIAQKYEKMPRYQICQISSLSPSYVDAGFTAGGFATTPELDAFIKPYIKQGISTEAHLRWAYLPAIDGYSTTYPGLIWRLLSNSVVLKQESEDSQWYFDALKPYQHYIPIKNKMEDLIEKIDWARSHDAECRAISANAQEFILNNLMMEDIYFYMFQVYNAYEKTQDFNTQSLLSETESDPAWVRIR